MSSDDLVSESAVWHNTVLWGIGEPGTEDFDESTALGETGSWEHLDNVWKFI